MNYSTDGTAGLTGRKILIIGTGHMAEPVYGSLLQRRDVRAEDVTLICGNSPGKDKAAIRQKLEAAGVDTAKPALYGRDEAFDITAPDIILYCAKPQQMKEIMPRYAPIIKHGAILVSIAAGVTVADFKRQADTEITVVRAMPHLPLALCGVFAETDADYALTVPLLEGLGRPIRLTTEDDMHPYIAHAGSSPAFIAQFLHRMGDNASLRAQLAALAENSTTGDVAAPVRRFYENWLKVARHDLGDKAEPIINATLAGTLAHLEAHPEPSLEEFIARVRSPRGTTNAGLLFMGSPPPQEPRFGNAQQLENQNRLAEHYGTTLTPEQSIVYATLATVARSVGMQRQADDPLGGVTAEAIEIMAKKTLLSTA